MSSPYELLKGNKPKQEIYLPKTLELANSLFLAFIQKNNLIGLKLCLIMSGAKSQIKYDENNAVRFNVDMLCDVMNTSRKELSTNLKKTVDVHFTYTNSEGGLGYTTPIHSYEYVNRNKEVLIEVSSKAKSLFTELGKGQYAFSSANANNLMSLQHKHSLKMQLLLELINNFDDDIAKRKRYDLDELNGYFGTKYKRYIDLERRILKPVKEEIDSNSTLTFDYFLNDEASGTGRPKIKEVVIDLIKTTKKIEQQHKQQTFKETRIQKDLLQYIDKQFYKDGYTWNILSISQIDKNNFQVFVRDIEDKAYTKLFEISKAQLKVAK